MAMPDWKPPTHFSPVADERRGRLVQKSFRSEALGKEVSVTVYQPAGYEAGKARYPVAYVHNGKTARDLELPLTLDNLIGSRIEPLIAVLIDEQAPFFGLENYAKMCGVELPAFIDQNFRTITTRESRAHIGWGFGAMAVTQSALSHADTSGKLAAQSPFILSTATIDPFMKNASEFPMQVYIDWGKYDTRSPLEFWDVSAFGKMLTQYFRDHGYEPVGGQFNEGSEAPAWRNRTDDLLQALFPLKK
jgi:enterochelin esterase-like enzyme